MRRGFKDSCVTEISPTMLLEESSAIPLTIHPAFVGSGTLGMGIDASGLQSLDSRMAPAFNLEPSMDDLYLLRQGYVSGHLGLAGSATLENFMPLGYLTWSMDIAGDEVSPANLAAATNWRRSVDLTTASVETTMLLLHKVQLRIRVFIPYGTDAVQIEFGVKAYDTRNQAIEAPLPITLRVQLNLATRDGRGIFDSTRPGDDCIELSVAAHEQYDLRFRWQHDGSWDLVEAEAYGIRHVGVAGNAEHVFRCAIDLSAVEQGRPWDYERSRQSHVTDWATFWGGVASIGVGDVERDFMYANSLYLLRSGHDYAQGGTGSFLIQHAPGWHASTFWDMTFITDGLLHAGAVELVRPFVKWLAAVVRPEGRPYPWMMAYDGSTTISEADDPGVVVNLAFATAAIRFYLEHPDEAIFMSEVWPVCNLVCRYMAEEMFSWEDSLEGGHYVLSVPCGHDVGSMSEALINETYTALWAVGTLAKSLALAEDHGLNPAWMDKARGIVGGFYLEHDGQGYLHARGVSVEEFSYASWLPNLLYPTEGLRFLDAVLYESTRSRATFAELYMAKQGDFQPWCCFWGASSDLRRGSVESAHAQIQDGLGHIYGPGYFCEVGPGQWGNAILPPYPTPHGAFLVAASEQLLMGSYWNREVSLFTGVPQEWRERELWCRNLHSGNGVTMDGEFSGDMLRASLTGNGDYSVHCRVPKNLVAETVQVLCDWHPVGAMVDSERGIVSFPLRLGPGKTLIQISSVPL